MESTFENENTVDTLSYEPVLFFIICQSDWIDKHQRLKGIIPLAI